MKIVIADGELGTFNLSWTPKKGLTASPTIYNKLSSHGSLRKMHEYTSKLSELARYIYQTEITKNVTLTFYTVGCFLARKGKYDCLCLTDIWLQVGRPVTPPKHFLFNAYGEKTPALNRLLSTIYQQTGCTKLDGYARFLYVHDRNWYAHPTIATAYIEWVFSGD